MMPYDLGDAMVKLVKYTSGYGIIQSVFVYNKIIFDIEP
jgi:hypothetical protein